MLFLSYFSLYFRLYLVIERCQIFSSSKVLTSLLKLFCYQFYQHFTSSFFVRKSSKQLLCTCNLYLKFLAQGNRQKRSLINVGEIDCCWVTKLRLNVSILFLVINLSRSYKQVLLFQHWNRFLNEKILKENFYVTFVNQWKGTSLFEILSQTFVVDEVMTIFKNRNLHTLGVNFISRIFPKFLLIIYSFNNWWNWMAIFLVSTMRWRLLNWQKKFDEIISWFLQWVNEKWKNRKFIRARKSKY